MQNGDMVSGSYICLQTEVTAYRRFFARRWVVIAGHCTNAVEQALHNVN
jgi:hypothetical protein